MRKLIVLFVLATALAGQQPKPIASVTEIMKAMTVPASNAIFNVAREPPKDDAGWQAIRNYAVLLGESGNLLLIGDRAQDTEVWRSTSLGLVEAGAAALKAAKAKDADGINEAGNLMIDACELCHEEHWQR